MEFTPVVTVLAIASLFAVWCALYVLAGLVLPNAPKSGRNAFVMTLHAIAILGLAVWCEFYNTDPCDNPGAESTTKETILVIHILSGILYDLFHGFFVGEFENLRQLIHHTLVTMMLTVALSTGRSGSEIAPFFFIAFVTFPISSILGLMKYYEMTEHVAYTVLDVLRVLLFVILRVPMGAYVVYCYLPNPAPNILIRIPIGVFNVVGLIFCVRNASRLYRQLVEKHEKVE